MNINMSDYPFIEVLLATYNGDNHIKEQLDSLFRQSYNNFGTIISDDCSTDTTNSILHAYSVKYPNQVVVLGHHKESLGSSGNFVKLLEHAQADYVMFCDQDDIWLPHKIEITLQKMKELESDCGKDIPLLVHTDLKVVDSDLKVIADSLWRFQKSDPETGSGLCRILLQNVATGCTLMINKALRDRALPIPQDAIMHDWWLALTAAAFGRIGFISEPTVLYRQHGLNEIGAREWHAGRICRELLNLERVLEDMVRTQNQAAAFLSRFQELLTPANREVVAAYAGLTRRGYWGKRRDLLRYNIRYTGVVRNVGLYLLA